MTRPKKSVARPNRGGTLRPQVDTPRRHFLLTVVTKAEYHQIQQYCSDHRISMSQFLADLVLRDAEKSKTKHNRKVLLRPTIELTPEEKFHLELLARLNEKESVGELIRDLIQPNLKAQRVHAPLETVTLRFYLSEDEHDTVTKHIATTGISARNYLAMLALRAIRKSKKNQSSSPSRKPQCQKPRNPCGNKVALGGKSR